MNAVKNTATSGIKVVGSVWEDFRAFIDKGNVFDLAVGIVIGASFTAIVNSFVNDLITPVISLAIQTQLENKYYPLKPSSACENSTLCSTPKLAQAQGVVTLNWGNFIQVVINFILIAVILFFLVKMYAAAFRRKKPVAAVTEKECISCCKSIPVKATRCCFCTSTVAADASATVTVDIDKKM